MTDIACRPRWRRALAVAWLAGALAGCASGPAPTAAAAAPAIAAADAVIASEVARQKLPGLAVAVIREGRVVQTVTTGQANVEHSVPVTGATVFQTGSLGKQFAAVAAMLLVEDGVLSLDDSITRFLPEAPAAWRPITVRHLLTHTSGIPDYDERTLDYRRDYTEDELARTAFGLPLEFPAGARWNYGNTGYVLLGVIIGKASGRFYGDLLRERVFAPLGMTTARVITEEDIVMHRAAGYRRVGEVLKNQAWVSPSLNTTADGSMYLSLDDWIRWADALRRRAVLRPSSWAQIFTPVRLNSGAAYPYGFGWQLPEGPGPAVVRHGGSWQGFETAYLHAVDAELTVIALCNLAGADPMTLAERVARAHLPALEPPPRTPQPDPDPALAARVQALLAATQSGQLREADFEHLRAGFFPAVPAAYAAQLKGLGPPQRLELLDRRQRGDDTVVTYRARFGDRPFLADLAVAPSGRFSAFRLRAEGP